MDLRQANYDDVSIQKSFDLEDLPPSDFIYHLLGRCTICCGDDHAAINCHAKICGNCHNFERACFCLRKVVGRLAKACNICNSLAHQREFCPGLIWCRRCNLLGHGANFCATESAPRFSWKKRKVERQDHISMNALPRVRSIIPPQNPNIPIKKLVWRPRKEVPIVGPPPSIVIGQTLPLQAVLPLPTPLPLSANEQSDTSSSSLLCLRLQRLLSPPLLPWLTSRRGRSSSC